MLNQSRPRCPASYRQVFLGGNSVLRLPRILLGFSLVVLKFLNGKLEWLSDGQEGLPHLFKLFQPLGSSRLGAINAVQLFQVSISIETTRNGQIMIAKLAYAYLDAMCRRGDMQVPATG